MTKQAFSNNLEKLRINHELSYRKLSKEVEISATTLLRYEKGTREPTASNVLKISKYFNVTTDYLLKNTSNKDTQSKELELIKKALKKMNQEEKNKMIELLRIVFSDAF